MGRGLRGGRACGRSRRPPSAASGSGLGVPEAPREGDFVGSDASFMYAAYAVSLSLSSCKFLRVFYGGEKVTRMYISKKETLIIMKNGPFG